MTLRIVIGLTVVVTAVMAGFYYAYATVIAAHRGLNSDVASDAMRRMNDAVERPLFYLLFMASVLLPIFAGMWLLVSTPASGVVIATGVIGAVCALLAAVVTIVANVPLNTRIGAGTIGWATFAESWARWNLIRTWLALVGAVGLAVALAAAD